MKPFALRIERWERVLATTDDPALANLAARHLRKIELLDWLTDAPPPSQLKPNGEHCSEPCSGSDAGPPEAPHSGNRERARASYPGGNVEHDPGSRWRAEHQ